MKKKLKTLAASNSEAYSFNTIMNDNSPKHNGIACPKCGNELFDSSPNTFYTSSPAQKAIHCSCGYVGYKVV